MLVKRRLLLRKSSSLNRNYLAKGSAIQRGSFPFLITTPIEKCRMDKKLIIVLAMAFSGLCDVIIEDVPFLNEANRIRSDSIGTHESEAKENLEIIVQRADGVLSIEPSPLKVLHYEGVLGTDPKRILTEEHLGDMTHLAWVMHAFYGEPEEKYRQFIKKVCAGLGHDIYTDR